MDDESEPINALSITAEQSTPPEPVIDPIPQPPPESKDAQAAKWFTIAFLIVIVLLTVFISVFWVSLVRTYIFGK